MRTVITRIALLLLTFVAIGALYALAIRPWILNWGSSAEERVRDLPGDGIVLGAAKSTTRAVTISAAADRVFPWVAQLGRNRDSRSQMPTGPSSGQHVSVALSHGAKIRRSSRIPALVSQRRDPSIRQTSIRIGRKWERRGHQRPLLVSPLSAW